MRDASHPVRLSYGYRLASESNNSVRVVTNCYKPYDTRFLPKSQEGDGEKGEIRRFPGKEVVKYNILWCFSAKWAKERPGARQTCSGARLRARAATRGRPYTRSAFSVGAAISRPYLRAIGKPRSVSEALRGSGKEMLSRSALRLVTLRALRDGQLLIAPRKTPRACGATAFSSARFAAALLPGAPRFALSRSAPSATVSKPLRLRKPVSGPFGPPIRLLRSGSYPPAPGRSALLLRQGCGDNGHGADPRGRGPRGPRMILSARGK